MHAADAGDIDCWAICETLFYLFANSDLYGITRESNKESTKTQAGKHWMSVSSPMIFIPSNF